MKPLAASPSQAVKYAGVVNSLEGKTSAIRKDEDEKQAKSSQSKRGRSGQVRSGKEVGSVLLQREALFEVKNNQQLRPSEQFFMNGLGTIEKHLWEAKIVGGMLQPFLDISFARGCSRQRFEVKNRRNGVLGAVFGDRLFKGTWLLREARFEVTY